MKKINSDLKNHTFEHTYIFTGKEDYLIKQYKKNFIDFFNNDSFNVKILNNEDLSNIDDIYSIIDQLPFLNEKKLIIFDKTNILNIKVDEKLIEHINDSKDFNIILFIDNEFNKTNLIYKYVLENGYICSLDTVDIKLIVKWLTMYFNRCNIAISENNLLYFINKIGTSMITLSHEADKLISYVCNKGTIEKDDIDAITSSNFQNVIYDITNNLNKNNKKEALNIYKNYILNNPTDAFKSNSYLFTLLKNNFEQILIVKEMLANRENKANIAKTLHISEGQAYFIIENSKLNSYQYFRKIYFSLINLDLKIKKGDISVENAVLSILS